jgi:hypothetical protein
MDIRALPAFRPKRTHRQFVVAIGLCTVFLAVSANAYRDAVTSPANSEYEAAENATQQIRIKRLKPADPESTETMLAANGLDVAGGSQSLSRRSA